MAKDSDTALPSPGDVRPALHMLAISLPVMSAVFGACLRVSLSYHQLFHRLDPLVFRLLVALLLALTTGQVACITAETWYILTTIIEGREDLEKQRVINACTQVCTTAIALLCQGFYIERLFATTKNVGVRAISISLWAVSIALFIAWNVKYLLHNGPHLNGDRKYNLGAASLWGLAAATAFVSICLIYFARLRRLRSPKPDSPLSLVSNGFELLSLSIQTFSLVTLNHVASAIGFTASLSTSSNQAAACVAFFFFNLFPGLSTYSIVYTLNQRKIELVQRQRDKADHKRQRARGDGEPNGRRKGKGKAREEARDEKVGQVSAEDDPSNWRGDFTSATNSLTTAAAGTGLGVSDVGPSAGRVASLNGRPGDGTDSEERGSRSRQLERLDRFSDLNYVEGPGGGTDQGDDEAWKQESYFSWGIVPAPPVPALRRIQEQSAGPRDPRTRGASVQMEEVGHGLNWEALEDCRVGRNVPSTRELDSRV